MTEWRVGELARRTGVTVRALHYYDRLGLLVPSARTAGGHRGYTGADVRRLHHILALREFGLSLAEIGAALDQPTDPVELVRRQLAVAEERIRAARALHLRLLRLHTALADRATPSAEEFVELIEEMTTMTQRLTPDQVTRLAAARAEAMATLTPQQLAELSRKRAEALAAMTPEEVADLQRVRREQMPVE
ncbi:MerR family transcriptional regulator [Actinokineospora sp. NBRC 105648]|uniref:MerR family transcriptional regulator n=1 Tax=Actinokineospora sp. NBRC 105648 TaxID=3032206 RepID=UPI0024A4764B|nr:MerR family transcriptional regulator [Actinokineospora sp. NBRC 105648]GLZ39090.1 transcriptional regulator [Actinokineospora sp. NBRC 105648]